jgi:hypothetical protein
MGIKPLSSDGPLARWLKWPVWAPVLLAAGGIRGVRRLFAPRSVAERRVDEKARQAGIRRELRGLPAEHAADAGPPRA